MKRYLAGLLACLLLLSGCVSKSVEVYEVPQETQVIEVQEPKEREPVTSETVPEFKEEPEEVETPQVEEKVAPKKEQAKPVETSKQGVQKPTVSGTPKQETKPAEVPKQEVQNPVETPSVEEKVSEVSISFSGPEGVSYNTSIPLTEGMSVWDCTKQALDSYGTSYKTTGMGKAIYISSMFGLAERDYGPMSGWMYNINGVEADKGAGQTTLKEGDVVEWYYSEG